MKPEFALASATEHWGQLLELNVEYMSWVAEQVAETFGIPVDEVVGMPVTQYAPTVIESLCAHTPPAGALYLVSVDGQLAGMGGVRPLGGKTAEVKRIYVRPRFRGMGLGLTILDRLLGDAAEFGYARLYLDTGPFMKSAHRLYEDRGFKDCAAYAGAEVPSQFHDRWRFMTKDLLGRRLLGRP